MRKVIIVLAFAIFILAQNNVCAQDRSDRSDRWEKYRAEKVSFLTNKLDLTPGEAEKFWPVYNQLEKERSQIQRERRGLERQVNEANENLSDPEIIKLTREFAGNLEKDCHLGTEYNEKFLKILPPKKVLALYKAEGEFRMYMFRKFRDHKEDKK